MYHASLSSLYRNSQWNTDHLSVQWASEVFVCLTERLQRTYIKENGVLVSKEEGIAGILLSVKNALFPQLI